MSRENNNIIISPISRKSIKTPQSLSLMKNYREKERIILPSNVENYCNEFVRLFQINSILYNACERVKIVHNVSRCISQASSRGVQKGLISERREIGEFNINRQSRGI